MPIPPRTPTGCWETHLEEIRPRTSYKHIHTIIIHSGAKFSKSGSDSVKTELKKAFEEETESDIIYFTFEVCLCYYSSVVSLLFHYLFGHAQKSVQKVNFFIFSSCSIFFKLPVKVFFVINVSFKINLRMMISTLYAYLVNYLHSTVHLS